MNKNFRKGLLIVIILIVAICPFAWTSKQLCRFTVARSLWEETGATITRDGMATFYMNLYNYVAVAKIIGMPGEPQSMTAVGNFIRQTPGGSATGNPGRGYLNVKIDLESTFQGGCKPWDTYPKEALPYDEDDKSITFNSELSLSNLALGALLLGSILGGLALGGRIFGRRTAPSGAQ